MPLRKIILAPDSFKETLTAAEAAAAMAEGVRRANPSIIAHECPIGDGGEGHALSIDFPPAESTVRVTNPKRSGEWCERQNDVAQNVSPRGSDASVLGSVSP